MTSVVHNHDGLVVNYALAQYNFTVEPHKVSPKKNRWSKQAFHPTTLSTLQFIIENARLPLGPGTVSYGVKGLQWTPTPRDVFVNKGHVEQIVTNCCSPNAVSASSYEPGWPG